jgi:hypothetical protein
MRPEGMNATTQFQPQVKARGGKADQRSVRPVRWPRKTGHGVSLLPIWRTNGNEAHEMALQRGLQGQVCAGGYPRSATPQGDTQDRSVRAPRFRPIVQVPKRMVGPRAACAIALRMPLYLHIYVYVLRCRQSSGNIKIHLELLCPAALPLPANCLVSSK